MENELREAFELFDRDGNNSIGVTELHVVMQAIGRQMELNEVEANIRKIKEESRRQGQTPTSDGAGGEALELNLQEFITFISAQMM